MHYTFPKVIRQMAPSKTNSFNKLHFAQTAWIQPAGAVSHLESWFSSLAPGQACAFSDIRDSRNLHGKAKAPEHPHPEGHRGHPRSLKLSLSRAKSSSGFLQAAQVNPALMEVCSLTLPQFPLNSNFFKWFYEKIQNFSRNMHLSENSYIWSKCFLNNLHLLACISYNLVSNTTLGCFGVWGETRCLNLIEQAEPTKHQGKKMTLESNAGEKRNFRALKWQLLDWCDIIRFSCSMFR